MHVTGVEQLRKKFAKLANEGVKKAVKAGVGGAMTVMARAARAEINASSASPALKREARKTIGRRIVRSDEGGLTAKVGFAVGKSTKRVRAKAAAKAAGRTGDGVGVSSNDIHWFVLGTEERFHGHKTVWGTLRPTGNPVSPTGRIKPLLADAIPFAVAKCSSQAGDAAVVRAHEVLTKFAQ
jgi:hypothetical protein